MKQIHSLLLSFIFFTLHANGQDSIQTRIPTPCLSELLKGTELEQSNVSDSTRLEFRLWICSFFQPDNLIQVTKSSDDKWDYHLGYFKDIDSTRIFVFQDSLKRQVDWKQFEQQLDSLCVDQIPDQKDLKLITYVNGKEYQFENARFFSSIMDGGDYTFEIFEPNQQRVIHYNNPESYLEKLEQAGISTREHTDFIALLKLFHQTFELKKLYYTQARELLGPTKTPSDPNEKIDDKQQRKQSNCSLFNLVQLGQSSIELFNVATV